MKNSAESNFSVNVGLSAIDLFELKSMVVNFVKSKAEEKIITPNQKKAGSSVVTLGEYCKVGDPTPEELILLIELVQKASDPHDDINCGVIKVTLSLPIK